MGEIALIRRYNEELVDSFVSISGDTDMYIGLEDEEDGIKDL